MNKQELIERIKCLKNLFGNKAEYIEIDAAIELIEQLDEPQKTVVPQFVADWIETCKENNIISLSGAFEYAKEEVDTWLSDWKNQEIFASAWIFGYEVEKEKRYYVRFKWIEESYSYLTLIKHLNTWTLSSIKLDKKFRTEHTKKQLEEAGFGWVFDCEGIELEEVQDDSKV
jgi:Protein of unknown function (DUF1642).